MSERAVSIPKIYLVPLQVTKLGVDPGKLAEILNRQFRWHFGPDWGFEDHPEVVLAGEVPEGGHGLYLLEDSNQARARGLVDSGDGTPVPGRVYVRSSLEMGLEPSVVASAELFAMVLDPRNDATAPGPDGLRAFDPCEPVLGDSYEIDGVKVADYVLRSYFGEEAGDSPRYDHRGLVKEPWEVRPGGYVHEFRAGRWELKFGPGDLNHRFDLVERPRAFDRVIRARAEARKGLS